MKNRVMFVSRDYKLFEKQNEEYMIQIEVEEYENKVSLKVLTMCVYFEEQLIEMATKIWSDKKCKIVYSSGMPLKYYTYREFMKEVM